MPEIDPPYFYVLVRDELASMDRGKSDAQVSHATSEFHQEVSRIHRSTETVITALKSRNLAMFDEWCGDRDFGVAIVLAGDLASIKGAVEMAQRAGYLGKITHDPTYTVRDGKVWHSLPVDTCGWMFGPKGELRPLLNSWPLLKPRDPNESNW